MFEVGDEVILLDGTSLIGRVLKISKTASAYKVSVGQSEGRWYSAEELAPARADASGEADAGDDDALPSDGMDSLDYAVAMLGSEFMKNNRYAAVHHHFKAIDEWKVEALEEEAQLRAELASVKAERDAARDLLEAVERNMPQSEEQSRELVRLAPIAWSAWVSGQLIRAHMKAQAAVSD